MPFCLIILNLYIDRWLQFYNRWWEKKVFNFNLYYYLFIIYITWFCDLLVWETGSVGYCVTVKSTKILLLPPKYEIIMVPFIHFTNIATAILDFSLLRLVKLSPLILCAFFLVSVLCFFFMVLSLKLLHFLALKGDNNKITVTVC